ncbi:MAG: PadR family transcriptional regulator [Devosia sp.]|nr:PadR family transcriptional regulator [Devosia sp.]
MNVKTLCLSILYEGEATGYEIRRLSVEGECSYFVEASFGSIYPALAKLELEQLVTSRVEQQDGKPAKKVYAITDAGRAAFIDALHEPLSEEVFRSPFLLFARFAHLLPAEIVRARVEEHLSRIGDGKQHMVSALEKHGAHAPDAWVIRYGLATIEAAEKHLKSHMSELIAMAGSAAVTKDAAE